MEKASDPRPIYKRGKFVAYFTVASLLVAAMIANAIVPGAVSSDVQGKLAEAVALGLPVLLAGQSLVDFRRAKTVAEINGTKPAAS